MLKLNSYFACAMALGIAFTSCSSDLLEPQASVVDGMVQVKSLSKEQAFKIFSEALSKAVSQNISVREFFKTQAMKRFDNNNDIFYPLVKDCVVGNAKLKDVVAQYLPHNITMDMIEQSVPLLNIYMPELAGCKVATLDTSDSELPVLFDNKKGQGMVDISLVPMTLEYYNKKF